MRIVLMLFMLTGFQGITAVAWSCNTTTYAGCSPEELRAIQQQQFQGRQRTTTRSSEYWRDRQYADRVRAEEQRHEKELAEIEAEAEKEAARRRSDSYNDYYYCGGTYFSGSYYKHCETQRPPVIVRPVPPIYHRPKPVPPIEVVPKPKPELKGNIYSNTSPKRVPSAIN